MKFHLKRLSNMRSRILIFFIPAASATFASDPPESFPLFGNWSDSYFVAVVVTD